MDYRKARGNPVDTNVEKRTDASTNNKDPVIDYRREHQTIPFCYNCLFTALITASTLTSVKYGNWFVQGDIVPKSCIGKQGRYN